MTDELDDMGRTREDRWASLLRDANAGGRASYVQFLNDIAPVLRGIIAARCGRPKEDCEDILQNVLIAIHEKRHTWRDGEPVGPWAYAIARYKTVDAMRLSMRRPTVSYDGTELDIVDEASHDPTAAADLDRLLGKLDATSALIVRQIRLEGRTAEEVGRTLGMTPGAVRVALHRAMAKLSALAVADQTEQSGKARE
ncbi:RNA polymerase sigma-70 factor, ECF subfamily [Loktanella sp. DSM 29012]|uniref:sigma-70 family RNA polymerase sigma factor n=1 Tax=Loktanella sp. DSM 29012 TaxID=1881056 RepID=UPI0008D69D89|nr:sigma-70 family RNA polymerase sigma factor [Loktanella sp. DSM 29012]SEQ54656.1 RNA polymerase sigma-70 factor, ECF subfamily [Loktanella sp. DSM 29012]